MPIPTQQKASPAQRQHPKGWRGSSIVELLAVIAITVALAIMAIPVYNDYIDKAKVTIAFDTLDEIQKALKSYHREYQSYPPEPMDFLLAGTDSNGHTVFQSILLEKISEDITPVSYHLTSDSYTFIARAKDSEQTIMTMTPHKISY